MPDYRLGKPKERKINYKELEPYFPEKDKDQFGNEIPWSDDPKTTAWLVESAIKARDAEKERKQFEKKQKADQEEMARREQQRREEEKRRAELPHVPLGKKQFKTLLSGKYPRYTYKPNISTLMTPALIGVPPTFYQREGIGIRTIDIEPGIRYMRQLYRDNKLIWLEDNNTHKRFIDFVKNGETIDEAMNRLLNAAMQEPKK